jgi:GNAT superfamily N-acetyltransferase
MNKTEIVIAEEKDLCDINRIRQEIAAEPNSPHRTDPITHYDIAKSIKRITFLAKNQKQTIGYLALHNRTTFLEVCDAEFEVFILPTAQGNGVGTLLLKKMERYVIEETKISRFTLGVMNTNPRAKKLYVKHGYASSSKDHIGGKMEKQINR